MSHLSVLNISQAGGGADLASKAQILAYYELVLADLKVSLINFNFINIIRSLPGYFYSQFQDHFQDLHPG